MASSFSCQIRLLVSARDAAAAYNLEPVVRAADADGRFSTSVLAQQPACDIFQGAGIRFQKVDAATTGDATSAEALALLQIARDRLQQYRPDILLCGLSSPGHGGVDEALLAERSCPAFLMQDFWGEQNNFFGRGADAFFVLDEAAAQLSYRRHGRPSIVVGSPRHSAYGSLNPMALRQRVRQTLGLAEQSVVGLFGQSLHNATGYAETIKTWASAVTSLAPQITCLYRPHPRESLPDRARSERLLREHGLNVQIQSDLSVEETIVACDVICSVFSNCTYDAAFINRYSSEPIVTPVMLLFEPNMRRLYDSIVHLDEVPYRESGIAMVIGESGKISDEIALALTTKVKHDVWSAAHRTLNLPTHASQLILDHIAEAVGRLTADQSQ